MYKSSASFLPKTLGTSPRCAGEISATRLAARRDSVREMPQHSYASTARLTDPSSWTPAEYVAGFGLMEGNSINFSPPGSCDYSHVSLHRPVLSSSTASAIANQQAA